MLNTWDIETNSLRTRFEPQPNSYFVYGLVSRFTARHSRVMVSSVEGGRAEGFQRVFTAALESRSGDITLLVVNDARQAWSTEVSLNGLPPATLLNRYQVTSKQRDNPDLRIDPLQRFGPVKQGGKISMVLPPFSLTILSTYRLHHGDSGVISD
jgi:hypothetical protein